MPRVASEASVSAQVAASHARSAGKSSGPGPEPFAQLLPDPEPASAPAGGSGPREPKQVEKADSGAPAARTEQEAPARKTDRPDEQPETEIGQLIADLAAELTQLRADAALTVAPPPDVGVKPASLPVSVGAAGTPAVAPLPATDAPAPVVDPAAADTPEPAKPVPAVAEKAGPAPAKIVTIATEAAAKEPAPIAGTPPQAPPKPQQIQIDKAKPQSPVTNRAEQPTAEPAVELAEPETGKPAPPAEAEAEAEAKSGKRAAPREAAEPSTAPKANPHAEIRAPAANSPAADIRGPDIKVGPPLDLATAAIQSAPPAHSAAPAAAPPPAQLAPPVPVPFGGLAVAIAANAHGGRNRFEIRLDPPELGRIDVRLHFDAKGHVTSHLIVDRSETLDLLRRDAADLERSLQQAGLKTSDNGLQFSLRDQSPGADTDGRGRGPSAHLVVPDSEPAADIVMRGYTRTGEGAGVDIRV